MAKTQIVVGDDGLEFVTEAGRVLASLTPTETGGHLVLYNAENTPSVALISTQGVGSVEVCGTDGVALVRASCAGSGGAVQVNDKAGDVKLLLTLIDEEGMFFAFNEGGQSVAIIGSEGGDGGVDIRDRHGAHVFGVPVWKFARTASPDDPTEAA